MSLAGDDYPQDERHGVTHWLWKRFAALDDGRLIRSIFFALLGGTLIVLGLDLRDLLQRPPPVLPDMDNPVLPAVQRPDTAPGPLTAPAPETHIESTPEELRKPLEVALLKDGVLRLKGAINIGAAATFGAEIEKHGEYVKTVSLNSPGGSVQDALAIAAIVRDRGYNTRVDKGAYCASSCPIVLAGGKKRLVHEKSVIGVHQMFAGAGSTLSTSQAMSDAQTATAEITRHLKAMGVSTELWVHALETPPNRLYYLSTGEMLEYKLATGIIGEKKARK